MPEVEAATSVIVFGEIRRGIEMLRPRDAASAGVLEGWLLGLRARFGTRLLDFDEACAQAWGRIMAVGRPPPVDGMLVATALANGLALVTRNKRHTEGFGVPVLDPFE